MIVKETQRIKLNEIGTSSLRRYDNDHIPTYERRKSFTPSHHTTSGYASSYGTLPRFNRSQTPSYVSRESNFASNREYKSMSRFSTDRERSESDDNANQRFEKLYNRYVKGHDVQNDHSTNDNAKFLSDGKKYISCSSETEIEADDEETEEEVLFGDNDNEFKDVLRDIAKLNENDILE
ncbi:unnamed protein product, partial [Onchocerca ochengi]|uniref:Uncharacterized protein n=1 Tax=Onchocerca ochengi TaxID=42157 RepID=A0A182ERH9_ONCOC